MNENFGPDPKKMTLPAPTPGDLFLLFHHLPFDFSENLPLQLGPSVCLDETPQTILDSADKGLADYLLPGYSLPGEGLNNCCLRCFSRSTNLEQLHPKDLLFLSVLALRLHAPINMRIGGMFRLGENGDCILDPTPLELSSPWSRQGLESYLPLDINKSCEIAKRLVGLEQGDYIKLKTALIFFGQVTLGISNSFQLSYLGLFAALEALFVPGNKKSATLSRRISNFLSNFPFPEPIEPWIKNEYIKGRDKIAHGGLRNATFGARLNPESYKSFGRLHEITRISLLGFLSLEDELLRQLSQSSGPSLQRTLDQIKSLSQKHLGENQKMWID
ncbi:MAG: hypothetical protein KC592_05095 [Nitrospira sp.]|nr:hypothetical protein [Nitrospira sp.]